MFNKFLDQFKQLGKSDKTIQNYVSTWNAFEKWMKQGNPYL
ncbi:hypothetical protein [Paenibacillus glacialis]|nr:hypothetical protein [Paenibacillus glacialis]